MLIHRILSAIVLIPIVLWAVYRGGLLYFAVVSIASLLAAHEFYSMMVQGGHRPSYPLGMALTALLLLDACYPLWQLSRLSLAAALILSLIWQLLQRESRDDEWSRLGGVHLLQSDSSQYWRDHSSDALVNWALTLAGALYVGWLASHFISLRDLPQGMGWTALTLLSTWACDTGAYSVGMAFGRHPFFPHISPHKTWEGAIGGWGSGVAVAALVGYLIGVGVGHGLLLGVVIALAATFGDLAESLLKRQVGVKDSGRLIPGHGGMLDRIDSLLFSVVVVYYYVVVVLV